MVDTTGISPRVRQDDWQLRSRGPGVFYADNLAERLAGGVAMPSDPGIQSAGGRDIGDGKGMAWVERSDIALSGGACRGLRRVHRLSGGSSDWNIRPWSYAPRGVTRPRLDGIERPVVCTEIDPAITARSKYNPRALPVISHFYGQVSLRAEPGQLWERPWYWLTSQQMAEFGAVGTRPGLHTTKLIFWTGGQSPDQIATNWKHASQALDVLFYEGNSSTSTWTPLVTGFMQPDQWVTIEILVSAQHTGYINDDRSRRSVPGGDPVFVAMWAAPYGEEPMLIGYTSPGEQPGPGWIPSRLNDDRNPIFKFQQASGDDHSSFGMRVIGPEQGGIPPNAQAFTVAKYAPAHARKPGTDPLGATSARYYKRDLNQHFNPGRMQSWGKGVAIGFTSGALTDAAYVPRHPFLDRSLASAELQNFKQAVILDTAYYGREVDLPNGKSAELHRIVLEQPLPVAPAVGDCLAVGGRIHKGHGIERDLPGFSESRQYYDEVLFGIDPIPFPHQASVPLPMPWLD
jgi:hypothetical protein